MAGGLIELVAKGIIDLFLISDPQITFFKIVYRRYTNFSTEIVPQSFTVKPDFGKRVTCILSRTADLIRKMYLVITLPNIPIFKDENGNIDPYLKFAWVKRIGYALIKRIDIEIGDELIDRQYGDWLNIWNELTLDKKTNIEKILGNVKELTDFTNGKKMYKLFIPLQFWFNRNTGLALPIISLQYNHIKVNLEIEEVEKCFILAPTHCIKIDNDFVNFKPFEFLKQTINGITSIARYVGFDVVTKKLYISRYTDNPFCSIKQDLTEFEDEFEIREFLQNDTNSKYSIFGLESGFIAYPQLNSVERVYQSETRHNLIRDLHLKEVFMLIEYIYLDVDERIRFAKARHEYLIEQLLYNGEQTVDTINKSYKLNFTHPCKELFWVAQLSLAQSKRVNQPFNYTNSIILDNNNNPIGENIIEGETIIFNGLERLSFRDSEYFTDIQPYQYHSNAPETGINIYSFSLHPEKYQVSGSVNFTKLDFAELKTTVDCRINCKFTAKIRIYALVYNVLRIASGVTGLVFANDINNY